MRYHKIPKELKIKVRNYFYHRYHGRLFNEKTMLKELSHVLEEVWNVVIDYFQRILLITEIYSRKLPSTTTEMC